MAPCDFWLFPQLKTVLKGKRFEDIDAIQEECDEYAAHHSKRLFQKMFPAVAGPLEAVCQLTRRVF
jgi:hypothetical protein